MPPKAANPAPANPAQANPAQAKPISATPYGIVQEGDRVRDGKKRFSARRQVEWLRRSEKWDGLDSSVWKARSVLGIGGNGIVGQWGYHGTDPDMPKNIVVKQGTDSLGMAWESRLLKVMMATGSDHFVKLFKANFRAMGNGTSDIYDEVPFRNFGFYDSSLEVNRLYLEYCEKGDLNEYIDKFVPLRQKFHYPPEEYVWRIFGCLAKACLVMETGSEDPKTPDPKFTIPIAHFDLKPANILVGGRDTTEHARFNIMKVADFGLALPVPPLTTRRDPTWVAQSQWRATQTFMSPEQLYLDHYNRDISHQTNTWATGAIMHDLVYGQPPMPNKFSHTLNTATGRQDTITVQGSLLLTPISVMFMGNKRVPVYLPYSRHLIDTILYCLAFNPADRLSAARLVETVQTTLEIYDTMNSAAATPAPNAPLATAAPANAGPPTNAGPPENARPPPPAVDPFDFPDQPNIPPQGFGKLQQNQPARPLPDLKDAGIQGQHQPVGVALMGPDPVEPTLLFPPKPPIGPQTMMYRDYPHQFIPPSP